jgi:predicted MFS family arabinose efflux permease
MREPRLLLALLPALLWNLGMYVVYTYLAPLLHQALSLGDISGLLLVFGAGIVIGNVGGGAIADRIGAARSLTIGLIILALVYTTLDFSFKTVVGAVLALFIWGVMGALAFILQQYRLLNLAPQHANVILALNNSTLYLGVAGGAALGGVVLQFASVNSLSWLSAAIVLLALPILWLSLRIHATHAHPDNSETAPGSTRMMRHL